MASQITPVAGLTASFPQRKQLVSVKLNYYGISNNTRGWINSFLSQRKQLVSGKLNYYGISNNTHSWINSFLSPT